MNPVAPRLHSVRTLFLFLFFLLTPRSPFLPLSLWALGLKTSEGIVQFGDIGFGQIWRLSPGARGSLKILNTWDQEAIVNLEVTSADQDDLKRWGGLAAPLNWFWMPRKEYQLAPNAEIAGDLYVRPLAQKSLDQKPLTCYLQARASILGARGVSISPQVKVPVRLKIGDLKSPAPSVLFDGEPWIKTTVKPGGEINLSDENLMRLINRTETTQKVQLRVMGLEYDFLPGEAASSAPVRLMAGQPSWAQGSFALEISSGTGARPAIKISIPVKISLGMYGFLFEASKGLDVEPVALKAVMVEVQ